jgi:hypothetical protein
MPTDPKPHRWKAETASGVVRKLAPRGPAPAPAGETMAVRDVVRRCFHAHGDAPASTAISNGGGRQLTRPAVYVLFWGERWGVAPPPACAMGDLHGAFAKIIAGPYLSAAAQYGNEGLAALQGAYWIDHSHPPNHFSDDDVQREVTKLIDNHGLPYQASAYYMVILPPGIEASDKSLAGKHVYVREHEHGHDITVGWVLYDDDMNEMTRVFSHELVEGMTNPFGTGLQVKPADPVAWNEIGDVCTSVAPSNGIVVNAYWSQEDKACVVPTWVKIHDRKITSIRKRAGADEQRAIMLVGGVSIESNQPFYVTQEECIKDIDNGVRYFILAADGRRIEVAARAQFPRWAGGHAARFIATTDQSQEDALLSLPECPRGPGIPE